MTFMNLNDSAYENEFEHELNLD